jgi:lysophospholipase L1-like esterase
MERQTAAHVTGRLEQTRVFRRYVALGDSTTEGLVDPDRNGGFRGWADRLAETIAAAQTEPLEYANLAFRGMRLCEIREYQFEQALAMNPDLMTIFGGPNDIITAVRCDWESWRGQLADMFGEARQRDITVLTFTLPDFTGINPLSATWRPRALRLNELIRTEAERYGVLMVDFERYPKVSDPRLWYDDRLHANELGHQVVAAALAWRLGLVAGTAQSWTHPLPEEPFRPGPRQRLMSDVDWAVRYLGPWLGRGLRGTRDDRRITPKRPVPTVVPK